MIPIFAAAPAGAANCDAGQFPASYAAQAALKVACNSDAAVNVNHVDIHDAENASWHHGVARSVTLDPAAGNATTSASATINFAAGVLKPYDIRRPITANTATKLPIFKGGTFIIALAPAGCGNITPATAGCTSATISQPVNTNGVPAGSVYTLASVSVKVEHTYSRVLDDAVCAAATSTLTSVDAKWVGNDIGKSVSGGPFAPGTYIASVSGTTATLNQAHAGACTAGRLTTIGGTTYDTVSGDPVLWNGSASDGDTNGTNGDALGIKLNRTATGGQGFTCPAGSVLNMSAGAKLDSSGFTQGHVGTTVVIKGVGLVSTTAHSTKVIGSVGPGTLVTAGSTGATVGALTALKTSSTAAYPASGRLHLATSDNQGADLEYTSKDATTFLGVTDKSGLSTATFAVGKQIRGIEPQLGATLTTACVTVPAISTTVGNAAVGVPGANAPVEKSPMMTLGAVLNLNPALVKTQGDCDFGAVGAAGDLFEGFMVVGGYSNINADWAANASSPMAATAQIFFPTSVIAFNGFVAPKLGGEVATAANPTATPLPHYTFQFPILPTSLAVCLTGGVPTNETQLTFGIDSSTYAVAPFLATGSGNPSDPGVRSLLPMEGTFSQVVDLITNPSTNVLSDTSTGCLIGPPTDLPGTPCGDG